MNKLLRIFLKINKYKMINQKCIHKNKIINKSNIKRQGPKQSAIVTGRREEGDLKWGSGLAGGVGTNN